MDPKKEWITAKEAMALLKITSRTTMYKYAYKNRLRVSKPMGKLYYNLAEIMASIEKRAVKMGF